MTQLISCVVENTEVKFGAQEARIVRAQKCQVT